MRAHNKETDARRFEQAAEWLVKLETLGEAQLSPEELQTWDEWAADDANRAAFDELAAVRQQLKSVPPVPWPTAAELHADRLSDASSSDELRYESFATRRESTQRTWFPQRRWRWLAAMGVAAGLIVFFGYALTRYQNSNILVAETYATGAGEHRSVELPDGSTFVLGGASVLSARYTERERLFVLEQGEALFRVAHSANRPFRVHAGNGTITALGTKFNVRHNNRRVVVTVSEGLVEVAPMVAMQEGPPHDALSADVPRWIPMRVQPNQEMSYGAEGKASAVEHTDAAIVTAWSHGTLVYRRRALAEVIEDIKRYWPHRVTLGPGAGDLLYSGTVSERNILAWVRGLPEIFPVDVQEQDADHLIIQLREQ